MQQATDEKRKAAALFDASTDFEEKTDRHEITIIQHPIQQQPHQLPARTDSQRPVNTFTIVFAVVRNFPKWGSVIVALAVVAGYIYLRAIGAVKWP